MDFLRILIAAAICTGILAVTDFGHIVNIFICIFTFGLVRVVFWYSKKDKDKAIETDKG